MAAVLLYLVNIKVLDPVGTVQDKAVISLDPVISFCGILDPQVFIDHIGIDQGGCERRGVSGILAFRLYHGLTEHTETYHGDDCGSYAEYQCDRYDYLSAERKALLCEHGKIDPVP